MKLKTKTRNLILSSIILGIATILLIMLTPQSNAAQASSLTNRPLVTPNQDAYNIENAKAQPLNNSKFAENKDVLLSSKPNEPDFRSDFSFFKLENLPSLKNKTIENISNELLLSFPSVVELLSFIDEQEDDEAKLRNFYSTLLESLPTKDLDLLFKEDIHTYFWFKLLGEAKMRDLNVRETRKLYKLILTTTIDTIQEQIKATVSLEKQAKICTEIRHEARLYTRLRGPWVAQKMAELRDFYEYSNSQGPTYEYLLSKNMTMLHVNGLKDPKMNEVYSSMIESALKTNEVVDDLLINPRPLAK